MKKKISMLLVFCLVLSMIPIHLKAETIKKVSTSEKTENEKAESNKSSNVTSQALSEGAIIVSDEEPTTSDLEKVVKMVKAKITIPKDYKVLRHSYDENDSSEGRWSLTWSNAKNTKSIRVNCDTKGNVITYEDSEQYTNYNAPKYLKNELQKNAIKFINKVAPKIAKKIEYVSSSYDGMYSGQYTFSYQRIENGIPMPDNGVTVSVNYETGKIALLSVNWIYDITIPGKETKLTKTEATKKINEAMNMKLSYFDSYKTDKNGNTKTHAFLAYEPEIGYISVDAKTGEVYKADTTLNTEYEKGSEESKSDSTADVSNDGVALTDSEVKSIKELEGLISKKEAVKVITSSDSLYLHENLKKANANLTKVEDYNQPTKIQYIWNISFTGTSMSKDSKGFTPHAYATVDAKSGKILSFYANVPTYYDYSKEKWDDIKVKYTAKESKEIFEKFVKSEILEYFNQSRFYSNDNDYIVAYKGEEPVYGGYYLNYKRVNEGIDYLNNGINGAVDGVTGKIYSYNYHWSKDITFDSKKGIISEQDAFNKYISNEGYRLMYEIKTDNDKRTVRLVYRPDISPGLISAYTGEQLDGDGSVYKKKSTYTYNDIDKEQSKKAILLLADMGVGFEGGKFLANQNITKGEFINLCSVLDNIETSLTKKQETSKIKRMDAVKQLITSTGLNKIAKYNNIYQTSFKDSKEIPKSYLGYVALADALDIVSGSNFRPTDYLTRGEAADMIIQLMIAKSLLEENERE